MKKHGQKRGNRQRRKHKIRPHNPKSHDKDKTENNLETAQQNKNKVRTMHRANQIRIQQKTQGRMAQRKERMARRRNGRSNTKT